MTKQNFSKYSVIFAIILMDLLVGTEFDLFVPSFPELQDHFGLTPFWVEAILSVNFIGYCLSLFVVGELGDRYGRKRIIVSGLIIFIVGTLLCLKGFSYPVFLLGRFLQGIGVAAPGILSFLIIADTYPLKQQQFLMGMLNGVMNLSVGIAPVVGSYITLHFNWQGNFTTLLALGLITLTITLMVIPTHTFSQQSETLSPQGYKTLLQSKLVMLLIVNIACMFVPYGIFVGMSPLLYLKDLGVSLSHFGYYQGILAFVFALGSILFGWIVSRWDQNKWLWVAVYLYCVGLFFVAWVTIANSTNPVFITLAVLCFVISQIIPTTVIFPLSLNLMPQNKGRISAMIQGTRLILASLGLQLAGHYYQGSFRNTGMIMLFFILIAVLTHVMIMNNRKL